jgi:hypothetical protein
MRNDVNIDQYQCDFVALFSPALYERLIWRDRPEAWMPVRMKRSSGETNDGPESAVKELALGSRDEIPLDEHRGFHRPVVANSLERTFGKKATLVESAAISRHVHAGGGQWSASKFCLLS